MVDAVVSFVLERLADFLIQEAVFLGRVTNEVKWLQNELGWLQCYIVNAEEKQVDNPMIRKWLSDITEIAYDIEDVLDKFIVQVHDDEDGGTKKTKTISCFPCIKGKEKVDLHNIGKEVEELKKRINDLSRKRELYGLQDFTDKGNGKSHSTSLARLRQLRRATSFSVEERVFGFEDDATRLLARLLDEDPRRFVISIYGMGGLGKTTLASQLYHNHDVKTKFNSRAWVSMSQDYNNHDLLMRIIRSFGITTVRMEELKHMTEEDLERYLYGSLQGQSYLVVIDDVWQKEAWESLKRAFPDDSNGSRVIITTRIKEVAERSDNRTHAHKLRFLRQDESWQLFCERAFGNSNGDDVDAELEALGLEMVQKCSGLPLAIVVLGGLLSTKSKPQEWRAVHEHIWQNLRNDSIHISYLLALTFNDLSYHLKLCFLYLSIFPEDFEINVEKLMRLWIAEGFIPQDDNRIVEDGAKDSFEELINRSLIQTEKRSWGKVVTCRIHDLLRNLAIEKAKELKLFGIYDPVNHSTHDSSSLLSSRRQVIYLGTENWLQQLNPNLRSLVFFHSHGCFSEIIWNIRNMCMKFRFLRVLDLDGFRALEGDRACEQIGKLIHLKYLCLRQSFIKTLPPSILNLKRLQTLDVLSVDTEVELPNEVSKLQELKHLIGRFSRPLPIDSLTTLQSLKYVGSENWREIQTEKLLNLRELWIYESFSLQRNEFLFVSIAKLKRLQQLSVVLPVSSLPSLHPLSHCSNLVDLRLYGKIEELPVDIHAVLPNLECLLLANSRLRVDPMILLEKLPCLVMLYLGFRFYSGKKLTCRAQGFPRLELIKLEEDGELEEWQLEEGAMPRLRGLDIPEDSKLRIPERLKSMPPPAESEFETGFELFLTTQAVVIP